ncbi:MAG: hypothetical protein WBD46_18050 [Acidobacteriaceae bacterium]
MISRQEFDASFASAAPPVGLPEPLQALWWEKKGDWSRAHGLVDELETTDAMAVHAHLHRRGGDLTNADYWYRRGGRAHFREGLEEEWNALVKALLAEK